MSQIKSVMVGGEQYNIAQAPAIQQKKLLSLVGARIAFNKAREDQIDIGFLVGALLAMPEDLLDQVAGIVLPKAFKHGAESPVSVADFQGRITQYFQLIAEAIRVNLEDFFDFLASSSAEAAGASGKGQ